MFIFECVCVCAKETKFAGNSKISQKLLLVRVRVGVV